ncbi:transcriptional regulator, AsnC family [gamma proteobacterium IMCC1989]|nr:transcriptional regulator, AsnC family [gamma proteobacterium IMCC1989]
MTFIVMVELERERIDQLDAFRRIVRKEVQVQQCYYVTGEADFTLICTARNMADFEALTQRLFFENANVRRFRTSVVMDRAKVGLSVSTEEE